MLATERTWERFRNHTATESDLKAILADYESEIAANPSLSRCPDFEGFIHPLIWQIERQDMPDGSETTMADALAVFAELAREENI